MENIVVFMFLEMFQHFCDVILGESCLVSLVSIGLGVLSVSHFFAAIVISFVFEISLQLPTRNTFLFISNIH